MTDDNTPRILGGRYEVGELIGRGGMAEVHIGHDTRLGRTVAIKMLRADLARDSSFLTRFRREAQSAAGLGHHAIVAVYDSGEDVFIETGGAKVDVPYIVMEYIDGRTLREILNEEGKLSPDEASRVTMGILAALEYSHEKGIVHRDIKPANVMLTRGGSVKVMDFGIARALADTGATMTSASAVVGTARYLSPEQAKGDSVDERSDLYSAGCVYYELLTGRTPFVGEPVSLVYQHISDTPKSPSEYEPAVPLAMDAVALHSLEKKREARYQSAERFRADIQAARTGQPLSPGAQASLAAAGSPTETLNRQPVAPAAPVRRDNTAELTASAAPRRHNGLWVIAGIVAVLAILGIGYLVMNGNSSAKLQAVPDVRNKSVADARALLTSDGFTIGTERAVKNDASDGTVVATDPSSGTDAKVGSAVNLDVSSGPGTVAIPNVAGQSVTAAQKTLADAHFTNVTVSQTKADDTKYPANQVSSTSPGIGNAVDPTSLITLTVSSGQVQVPTDLTGQGAVAAQTELSQKFLGSRITYQSTSNSNEFNKVINVPMAGDKVSVNTPVELIVGTPAARTETVTATPVPPSTTASPSTSSASTSSASPSSTPSSTASSSPTAASTPPPASR